LSDEEYYAVSLNGAIWNV